MQHECPAGGSNDGLESRRVLQGVQGGRLLQHSTLEREGKGYKNCALFYGKNLETIICSPQHKLQLRRGERIFSLCSYLVYRVIDSAWLRRKEIQDLFGL